MMKILSLCEINHCSYNWNCTEGLRDFELIILLIEIKILRVRMFCN